MPIYVAAYSPTIDTHDTTASTMITVTMFILLIIRVGENRDVLCL